MEANGGTNLTIITGPLEPRFKRCNYMYNCSAKYKHGKKKRSHFLSTLRLFSCCPRCSFSDDSIDMEGVPFPDDILFPYSSSSGV